MKRLKNLTKDEIIEEIIKTLPNITQVQYDTSSQLFYLMKIANKLGLYDGADYIQKGIK